MNSYPSGTNVTVQIPFLDLNGAAVSAVGMTLSYRILDELENVLQDTTALTAPASTATFATVTVNAAHNTLPPPTQRYVDGTPSANPVVTTMGLREIQLSMTTPNGVIISKVQYLVGAPDARLVLLQNSFQTYNLALMTASQLPLLSGWNIASETDRINAMSTAWLRLTKLGYFVRWPRDPDAQNYLNWFDSRNEIIIPRLWTVMTTDRWYSFYPETFRQAMRFAQVVEADQILTADPLSIKRKSGVFQERIGESSIMFRSGIPLDLGVSRQALAYIEGYVDFKITISRAH